MSQRETEKSEKLHGSLYVLYDLKSSRGYIIPYGVFHLQLFLRQIKTRSLYEPDELYKPYELFF